MSAYVCIQENVNIYNWQEPLTSLHVDLKTVQHQFFNPSLASGHQPHDEYNSKLEWVAVRWNLISSSLTMKMKSKM
jgi:hypothetical protein